MTDLLPQDPPAPKELMRLREELELSQAELARELGFTANGETIVRAWEHGFRNGAPCRPMPLAWRHIRIMVAIKRAMICYDRTGHRDPGDAALSALAHLHDNLPECLK